MDGESEAQREERLKSLWRQLDIQRKGYLDLSNLKSGLQKMNHREPLCHNIHEECRLTRWFYSAQGRR